MNEEFKVIAGELGEEVQLTVSLVKPAGEKEYTAVTLMIDGVGGDTLTFSPDNAVELANQILKAAEKANTANYNLLRNKEPL